MQNSASLVKYNTPTLVNTTGGKAKKNQKKSAAEKQTTQTEDILNSILPPRSVCLSELIFGIVRFQFLLRCPQRMDRGRPVVGSVCIKHSSN
jgi:hypothetical protein